MPRWVWLWAMLGVVSIARGQEPPQGDDLRRRYDETLVQLKAAQDRKNELSTENESLKQKLAETSRQLDQARAENQTLRQEVAESSNRTFLIRSQLAAWEKFVVRYPEIQSRWKVFSRLDLFSAREWLLTEQR